MRLAECEAETICNLGKDLEINLIAFWFPSAEKENFNLSDMLSQTEDKLKKEKEKYNGLETSHMVKY